MARMRVRVTGIEKVIRQLQQVNRQKENMSDANRQTGRTAVALARSLVPFESGMLSKSIRADHNRRTRLTLVAGGPSRRSHGGGVYASVVHYGKHTHRQKGPRPFLWEAMQRSQNTAERNMEGQLERIIRRAGLSRL